MAKHRTHSIEPCRVQGSLCSRRVKFFAWCSRLRLIAMALFKSMDKMKSGIPHSDGTATLSTELFMGDQRACGARNR
jgi:hypothetical protein